MQFKARYMIRAMVIPFKGGAMPEPNEYWMTIRADDLNAAIRKAEKYARKGFICCGVTQDEGRE